MLNIKKDFRIIVANPKECMHCLALLSAIGLKWASGNDPKEFCAFNMHIINYPVYFCIDIMKRITYGTTHYLSAYSSPSQANFNFSVKQFNKIVLQTIKGTYMEEHVKKKIDENIREVFNFFKTK